MGNRTAAEPDLVSRAPATGVEIGRIDRRLLNIVIALFGATFPRREAEVAEADGDGRHPLIVAPPWSVADRGRWQKALQLLLEAPFARDGGLYVREVQDRSGARIEIALPLPAAEYRGGAWLVGPFVDDAEADSWARQALAPGWVHDIDHHAGQTYVDVFFGDPDSPAPS